MLTNAFTPVSLATAAIFTVAEVPGGHGHAEIDPPAAADDAIDITVPLRTFRTQAAKALPHGRRPALQSTAIAWLQVRLGLSPAFAFVPV
jgi:hypothetical protein